MENTQTLEGYFRGNTKFMFHDGVELAKRSECRSLTKDAFQMLKLQNFTEFDIYDAFLLYAMYSMGHCTKDQLIMWMDIYQKHYPKKMLPSWNSKKLTKCISTLASKGFIYSADYVTPEKHVIVVYTCTYFGYTYFKNKLDMSYLPFDNNMIFHAEVETFKRMAAASVTLCIAKNAQCQAVSLSGKLIFGKDIGCNTLSTYGWAVMNVDGEEKLFVIEPIYFSVDQRVLSEEECIERTSRRMSDFETFCRNTRKNINMPIVPVFCVENMDGLQRFFQIAKKRRNADLYQRSLYTSENVVHYLGKDINKVFVYAQFESAGEDVKVSMKPIGKEWKTMG